MRSLLVAFALLCACQSAAPAPGEQRGELSPRRPTRCSPSPGEPASDRVRLGDCGGIGDPCALGWRCTGDGDCLSGRCSGNRCVAASCDDGLLDQNETDIDCGGACRRCEAGRRCAIDIDCESRSCVRGACLLERRAANPRASSGGG